VFQFTASGVSVMRRQSDGWVNATHILKVANFDKPQRTRILEKEVQRGVHEKVQGGYGKYQGTWVPLDRAKDIAVQYKVGEALEPLFSYEGSTTHPAPTAPKQSWKSNKTGPKRSTQFSGDEDDEGSNFSDVDGQHGKNGRATPQGTPYGTPRARIPAKRGRKVASMPARLAGGGDFKGSTTDTLSADLLPPAKKKRGRPSLASRKLSAPQKGRYTNGGPGPLTPSGSIIGATPIGSTPRGRPRQEGSYSGDSDFSSRSSSPSDYRSDSDTGNPATHAGYPVKLSPARMDEPIVQETRSVHITDINNNSSQEGGEGGPESDMLTAVYSNKLLDYFMATDASIPDFLVNPPPEFKVNQVIDDEGHTAFHWACAMGDLKIIEVLINLGADMSATNLAGETPLIRSVMFTNNYDRRTFPKVVELLRHTIFVADRKKQTVLHHIASSTSTRSKLSSMRYYTEIILAKMSETQPMPVLAEFVNRQDTAGDTALHIAARNGARKCAKVLLSYNALPDVVNKNGRTAQEYISEYEAQKQQLMQQVDNNNASHLKSSSSPLTMQNGYGRGANKYLLYSTPVQGRRNSNTETQQQQQPPPNTEPEPDRPPSTSHMNGRRGNYISNPHVSEVAIKATQRISPAMMEHLEELALAYDSELKEKDTDVEQVRQLLENMKRDVSVTDSAIAVLDQKLGNESEKLAKIEHAKQFVTANAVQLRRLLERTQSRDLAVLVQREENRIQSQLQQQLDGSGGDNSRSDCFNPDQVIGLASQLIALQNSRKKLVDEIVELFANAGVGSKMNDYRKLVSLCCGVKIDEIDDLLDGIAQALTESSSDDMAIPS
jgi:transcription factor MBP1